MAAAAFVAIAALLKLSMPGMQPFLTLYPAVLLSAFVGGRWAGIAAFAACTALAIYFLNSSGAGDATEAAAIDAVKSGQRVGVPATKAYGCSVKYASGN